MKEQDYIQAMKKLLNTQPMSSAEKLKDYQEKVKQTLEDMKESYNLSESLVKLMAEELNSSQ